MEIDEKRRNQVCLCRGKRDSLHVLGKQWRLARGRTHPEPGSVPREAAALAAGRRSGPDGPLSPGSDRGGVTPPRAPSRSRRPTRSPLIVFMSEDDSDRRRGAHAIIVIGSHASVTEERRIRLITSRSKDPSDFSYPRTESSFPGTLLPD